MGSGFALFMGGSRRMTSLDQSVSGETQGVQAASSARTVEQAMSRELFALGPAEPVERVIRSLLLLGLTAAPVIDDEGKPVGMLSLRDCLSHTGDTVGERMTTPVVMIWAHATLADAAELFADTNQHRAVVVDEEGHAIGMLSALDLVRALMGKPTPHPSVRVDYDEATGLFWTDAEPLDLQHVHDAPEGPGLFVLTDATGQLERIAWAEASEDIRARLMDLVLRTSGQPSPLARILERSGIRFRATFEPNASAREQTLLQLLGSSG